MVDLDLSQVNKYRHYVLQLDSCLMVLIGREIHRKVQFLIDDLSQLTQRDTVFIKISNIKFAIHNDILNNLNINLN